MSSNPNNTNASESTKEAQQQQPEVASAQGRSRIVSISGNNINAQTGGQTPDQNAPSGNQQPPKQSGGGPEGPATINRQGLSTAVSPPTVTLGGGNPQPSLQPRPQGNTAPSSTAQNQQDVPDNDDIDIEKMISTSEQEVSTIDKDQQERIEKQKYLMQAINSRAYFERLLYNNIETGEVVGTKLQYTKDPFGKTVYDYMNEPEVQEHIEFIAAEGDPMDGSPVDRQVTFYWKKPTF